MASASAGCYSPFVTPGRSWPDAGKANHGGFFPLGGLLDRAGKEFTLAGDLSRVLYDQSCFGLAVYDNELKRRIVPPYLKFFDAVQETQNETHNPHEGFESIAIWLKHAVTIVLEIEPHLRRQANCRICLSFAPRLHSLAQDGLAALERLSQALQVGKSLALLKSAPFQLDTTPAGPRPFEDFVEKAEHDIPRVLYDVQARSDGTLEIGVSLLTKRLQVRDHSLAAVKWAVHESVLAGRLRASLIDSSPVILPAIGRSYWTSGGSGVSENGRSRSPLAPSATPLRKPVPFDRFKVTATPLLWNWCQTFHSPDDQLSAADEMAITVKPAIAPEAIDDPAKPDPLNNGDPIRTLLAFKPGSVDEKIAKLKRCELLAYYSYKAMETVAGRRLEDREAYDLLKENGLPTDKGDLGELGDYSPPSFGSWDRYVRAGRGAHKEQKYEKKHGRAHGKSIVRPDEI